MIRFHIILIIPYGNNFKIYYFSKSMVQEKAKFVKKQLKHFGNHAPENILSELAQRCRRQLREIFSPL